MKPLPTAAELAVPTRRIVRLEAESKCAQTLALGEGVWQCQPMFTASPKSELKVPPPAVGWCRCGWAGGALDVAAFDEVLTKLHVELGAETDADIASVRHHADATAIAAVWSAYDDGYAPTASPVWATAPKAPGPGQVRVAVIDSALPDLDNGPGRPGQGLSDHGEFVGALIRDAACPSGDNGDAACAAWLSNHLALDLVLPPGGGTPISQPTIGGSFGYQSTVAEKIWEAVRDWRDDGAQAHLIINLSIGWEKTTAMGADGKPLAPSQSVRAALEAAVCEGALVIAAAGNAGGGSPPPTGLMEPAAWMKETVECGAAKAQLVHAVGGVDAMDLPLVPPRDGATPPLVAPAAFGSPPMGAVKKDTPGNLQPRTGTSLAAAAASATAAMVWRYAPKMTGDEVMAHLFEHGPALATTGPDACGLAYGACDEVRRLDPCAAVRAAEALRHGNSATGKCAPRKVGGGPAARLPAPALKTLASDAASEGRLITVTAAPKRIVPNPPGCPAGEYYSATGAVPAGTQFVCPSQQLPPESQILVSELPSVPECDVCYGELFDLGGSWELNLTLVMDPQNPAPIQFPGLRLYPTGSSPAASFDLRPYVPGGQLAPGGAYVIRGLALPGMNPSDPYTRGELVGTSRDSNGNRVAVREAVYIR